MSNNHQNRVTCNCIIFILCLVFIIFLSLVILITLNIWVFGYNEYDCNVQKITYPSEIPCNSTSPNWITCDCGNKCSSWTPCISLYAKIIDNIADNIADNNTVYPVRKSITNTNPHCTFNHQCSKTTDFDSLLISINDTVNSYINSTITCYWKSDSDYVYLEHDNIPAYIVLGIFIFFLLCVFCGIIKAIEYRSEIPNNIRVHDYDI